LAAVAAVSSLMLLGPVTAVVAAPPAPGPSAVTAIDPPVPVPVDEITPGMTGTGLTVAKGNTAEPFTVTVLGVLPGAIAAGVDLIVFEADSPALDQTGGIWAGMSGSPVYADDGRLLGAVSYGLTYSPSKIGGMTPAATMMELLDRPQAVTAAAARKRIALPPALRTDLVAARLLTASQASAGLAPLPIPLSVSGLNPTRLARLNADLERTGSPMRAYAGAAASGSPATAGSLFPGSNFAAAISYGDVTEAAIGTTTAVYNGTALAFGHPMIYSGPASLTAHAATSIAVLRDDLGGSFKLAVVGGVAGTVDWDGTVGLRAPLGAGPSGVVPIVSTVRSGDRQRTAVTWVTTDAYVADVATFHLAGNIDRMFDRVGAGRTEVGWVIQGTRPNGTTWRLSRSNLYASSYDASWSSTYELSSMIGLILNNPFIDVKLTDVSLTATVRPDYGAYTVDGVQAKQNGVWVEVTDGVAVTPGQPLDLRVRLRYYHGSTRLVTTRLDVPAYGVVGGVLSVEGKYQEYPELPQGTSFNNLLTQLRAVPHNNQLVVTLHLFDGEGEQTVNHTINLDEIVSGYLSYPVAAV
jgi:hypothetical protein